MALRSSIEYKLSILDEMVFADGDETADAAAEWSFSYDHKSLNTTNFI